MILAPAQRSRPHAIDTNFGSDRLEYGHGGLTISLEGMARMGVFLAIAGSGVVFSEPAPVDVLMLGLVVLLPLSGLQRYAPGMVLQLLIWLGCGAGALIASSLSREIGDSARHTAISFYLYAAFFVLAAFVAHNPAANARLVLRAWLLAGLIAAIAGLVGYFKLAPGAFDLFTRFGRAAGTFKDPNVLGAFLVPVILYSGHRILHRETRNVAVEVLGLAILVGALLLTFSRGAWINLAVAAVVYASLTLITLATPAARARLVMMLGLGLALATATLLAAMQHEEVARLLAERSALTHDYDVGPEGRFGGQAKALALVLANPLGLGAKQFATHYHAEDVHNVYVSMFLNAGWLGGLLYIAAMATTMVVGLVHVLRGTATRPLFLISYAALAANVVEGLVIDTDHWRHVYVLLALAWGLMGADHGQRLNRR